MLQKHFLEGCLLMIELVNVNNMAIMDYLFIFKQRIKIFKTLRIQDNITKTKTFLSYKVKFVSCFKNIFFKDHLLMIQLVNANNSTLMDLRVLVYLSTQN